MNIPAISTYRFYPNANFSNQNISFLAHPDFINLAKEYNITASNFFRRGGNYGAPNKEFQDVINVLKKTFNPQTLTKNKMFIAGLGDSQEPFSYLAVIKELIGDKKLEDVLELKTVDLQSRPSKEELFQNSYYEYLYKPEFASSSFVSDKVTNNTNYSGPSYYRVNSEIFQYLNSTYKNRKNSLWEKRLQDVIKKYPSEEFDIVSINNTLGYILDKNERNETVIHIDRILKKGGYFITDPFAQRLEKANLIDKYETVASGIFRKIRA